MNKKVNKDSDNTNKIEEETTQIIDSDFEHLKNYKDTNDLDFYLSEDHWNFHVNSILYKHLLIFHEGMEVGAFLSPKINPIFKPISDYSHLYGNLFNEAYRICHDIFAFKVPETKVAQLANQAATWKFRNLKDNDGKSIDLVPNVIDLIESYHILGMANAILTFANDQKDSIDRFLINISVYKDKGLFFNGFIHSFENYIEVYNIFICTTILDGSYLRHGYDYIRKDKHLRKNIPWYNNIAKELDIKMQESEDNKSSCINEQYNNNCQQFYGPVTNCTFNMQKASPSTPKKTKSSAQKKKSLDKLNIHPKTLNYFEHGNNSKLNKQQKRVDIVFDMWNRWDWISNETSNEDFNSLFEGEPRHCNIKWKVKTTIISILIKELLKKSYILKQTGQSATSMVKEQFGLTPNFDQKRLTEDELFKIKVTIYVLDIENPLKTQDKSRDNNYDISNEAFKVLLSGELHSSKHT